MLSIDLPASEGTKISEQSLDSCECKQDTAQRSPAISLIPNKVGASEIWRESFQDGMVKMGEVLLIVSSVALCR